MDYKIIGETVPVVEMKLRVGEQYIHNQGEWHTNQMEYQCQQMLVVE